MPKAEVENTPSRRHILGYMAGSVAVAAIGASAALADHRGGADHDLISACAAFDALEHQFQAFYQPSATPIEDDEWDRLTAPIEHQQKVLLSRICEARATTQAGFQARARTLALWADGITDHADDDSRPWDTRMIAALVRDMAMAS